MVKPKRRVARVIEEIEACVSADDVVAADVHAQTGSSEFHACLERGGIRVVGDEVSDKGVGGLRGGVGVDAAPDAAGVVAQAVGLRVWELFFGGGGTVPKLTVHLAWGVNMGVNGRKTGKAYFFSGPSIMQPPL
jgi:hypothetical protein